MKIETLRKHLEDLGDGGEVVILQGGGLTPRRIIEVDETWSGDLSVWITDDEDDRFTGSLSNFLAQSIAAEFMMRDTIADLESVGMTLVGDEVIGTQEQHEAFQRLQSEKMQANDDDKENDDE